jgi:2-methylisocitrate lyase-like PEP mutase family enzyme
MSTQEKYQQLNDLQKQNEIFVIANAWNGGSARILTAMGYKALATTSAGLAFSIGCQDSAGCLSREQVLENAGEVANATHLPVSVDLEEGFGSDPEACVKTVLQASKLGLVGGAIEDATGNKLDPIFDFQLSVDRISAASEASRDLPFMLTARAENFLYGRQDLDDTIRRLVAFADAGADVLYAPGLPSLEAIREVCSAVGKPVNVVMGLSQPKFSLAQLQEVGVSRVSVGGAFARAAIGAFYEAAKEVHEHGTFNFADSAMPDAIAASFMNSDKRGSSD